ncbi:MAG: hypothetical protein WC732_09000 [Candidatus Omnitrophota bacterium]
MKNTIAIFFVFTIVRIAASEDALVAGITQTLDTTPTHGVFIPPVLARHIVTAHSRVDASHPGGFGPEIVSLFPNHIPFRVSDPATRHSSSERTTPATT